MGNLVQRQVFSKLPPAVAGTAFVSSWKTNNTGVSATNQVRLPLIATGTYNFTVNWGDGSAVDTITTYNQAETTHTYSVIGTYTVTINGTINGWRFGNGGDRGKILSVTTWGDLRVGNTNGYFYGCTNLTLATVTDTLNLTGTTTLQNIFRGCTVLSTINNINSWNISGVTVLGRAFDSTVFNQDISGWVTNAVTDMSFMFYNNTAFNQNIGAWNVSACTNFDSFMGTKTPATFSAANLDAIYSGWSSRPVVATRTISFGTAQYSSAGVSGRAILTGAPNNWNITDGGINAVTTPFVSNWNTNNTSSGSSTATQIKLPLVSTGTYNFTVDWGDGSAVDTITTYNQAQTTHTYSVAGTYILTINGTINGWQFNNTGDRNKILSVTSFGDLRLGNSGFYFYGCQNLGLASLTDNLILTGTTNLTNAFNNCDALTTCPTINSWNVSAVTNMSQLFFSCNLFNADISGWNVGNVTNMSQMFQGAVAFNQNIGGWNTIKVTDMSDMFYAATAFNQNIGSWNVSVVTSFGGNFMGTKTPADFSTTNLDAIYSGWSSRTSASGILISFGSAKYTSASSAGRAILVGRSWSITDGGVVNPFVSSWNTNNISSGSSTATQVKLPLVSGGTYNFIVNWGDSTSSTITAYNQAAVTHTYASAGTYTISITGTCTGWRFNNTGDKLKLLSVTSWGDLRLGNITDCFYGCTNLTLTSVTDSLILTGTTKLYNLFGSCTSLTTVNNINSWNTSAITDFGYVFFGCTLFNQALTWNTSAATTMEGMFMNAAGFNQNIGTWNVSLVTNFTFFMEGKTPGTFSSANLDAIYNGWSTRAVKPSQSITFGTAKYTSASTAGRAILTASPNFWSITDGGVASASTAFVSSWQTDNTGTSATNQIQLPLVSTGTYNFNVDWGDSTNSTITTWNQAETLHTYAAAGTKTITITGTIIGFGFPSAQGDPQKLLSITSFGVLRLGNSNDYFRGCKNLSLAGVTDNLNLTGTTSLVNMFLDCWNLITCPTMNSWDVSAVTDMSNMFNSCYSFNQNIGSWNVSNVNYLNGTFGYCNSFNQNISGWNTSAVTVMSYAFYECVVFNQPIGTWNVGAVTDMTRMFAECFIFNQPLSSWNTANVTAMRSMFYNAHAFDQNIGAWNISNVNDIDQFMGTKTPTRFSAANLDAIYNGWSSRPVLPGKSISFGSAKYTAAGSAGKAILTGGTNLWAITDGGI
jgi:surface protein